ncbi:MAG TPA: ABC transporter substrate-binding protein [Tissierellaceae bacterium]
MLKRNKTKLAVIALSAALALTSCGNKDKDVNKEESQVVEEVKDETGLVHEKEMELKYAKHFKVDYYKDGYKKITDASDREILLIPEGKEIPEMEKEMLTLQMPIDTVGLYSTVDASWFRPINLMDKIATVTFDKEKWQMDEMIENFENETTTFVGKSSALDYELIQEVNPSLHLLSKSSEEKLFPKFDELELDYVSMGAYLEEDPRARMEWMKFVAALFDKEEEAEEYFENELKRIEEVVAKVEKDNSEKPNVAIIYFSPSKEIFNVTKPVGHQAVTTELAGGIPYPTAEMRGDVEGRGNNSMTNEEFYTQMQDADIIIYDNITGHGIQSMADLLQKAEFVSDLKAVEGKKVYGLQRTYWQSADKVADMVEDLYEVLNAPEGEFEENRFYFLMD